MSGCGNFNIFTFKNADGEMTWSLLNVQIYVDIEKFRELETDMMGVVKILTNQNSSDA